MIIASAWREAVFRVGIVSGPGLRALPGGRKTGFVHRQVRRAAVRRRLSASDAMTGRKRAARAPVADAEGDDGAPASAVLTFGPIFLADCEGRGPDRGMPTTCSGSVCRHSVIGASRQPRHT